MCRSHNLNIERKRIGRQAITREQEHPFDEPYDQHGGVGTWTLQHYAHPCSRGPEVISITARCPGRRVTSISLHLTVWPQHCQETKKLKVAFKVARVSLVRNDW